MKHETFNLDRVGDAFETIEDLILPSLTMMIDRAAGAQPGVDAESRAAELRALARQLEALTASFGLPHDVDGSPTE